MKFKLKAVNMQITAFPHPKCILFLADAEANKVRLHLELSQTAPTHFAGGHSLSSENF